MYHTYEEFSKLKSILAYCLLFVPCGADDKVTYSDQIYCTKLCLNKMGSQLTIIYHHFSLEVIWDARSYSAGTMPENCALHTTGGAYITVKIQRIKAVFRYSYQRKHLVCIRIYFFKSPNTRCCCFCLKSLFKIEQLTV